MRARLAATESVGGVRPGAVRIWRAYIYIMFIWYYIFYTSSSKYTSGVARCGGLANSVCVRARERV